MIRRNVQIFFILIIFHSQTVFPSALYLADTFNQSSSISGNITDVDKHFWRICIGGGSGMQIWTGSKYQNVIVGGLWGIDQSNWWQNPYLHSALWIDGAGLKIKNSSGEQKLDISVSIHSMVEWKSPRLAVGGGISVQLNAYDATYHWREDQRRIGFLLAPGLYGQFGTEKNNIEAGVNSRKHLIPGPLSFHINFTLLGTRFGYMTFYANMDKSGISD